MYQPAFPQYAQPYGTVQYQQPSMPPQTQPQMPRGIAGRMVGAPSEIVPNEVPMDGSEGVEPERHHLNGQVRARGRRSTRAGRWAYARGRSEPIGRLGIAYRRKHAGATETGPQDGQEGG